MSDYKQFLDWWFEEGKKLYEHKANSKMTEYDVAFEIAMLACTASKESDND